MHDKAVIVLTSRDPIVLEMGLLYARNARKNRWMTDVKLFLFGSSEIAAATEPAVREMIEAAVADGLTPRACRFCSDKYGVSEQLEALGCSVEYVGQPLSEAIRDGYVPLTW
jgi:hypothetical protein